MSVKRIHILCFLLPLLAGSIMLFHSPGLDAQNAPITTLATVGNAVSGPVDVPITVTGFTNIGAVSLCFDYQYAVLHFVQGTPNPALDGFAIGDQDMGGGKHRVTMGWYGSGATLPDGSVIMTVTFNYISGISALQFYDNGPSCEYADEDGAIVLNDIPQSTYYINGAVCGAIADPGPITGNPFLCPGQTGVLYIVNQIVNATGYTWTVPSGAALVSGSNTNAITVDYSLAAASGNITVKGVNVCSSGPVSQLPVTVNVLPVANAGTDQSIPYGTSTTLHAASGGTGTFTYYWSPETLLVNPDLQNPQTVNLSVSIIFTLIVTNSTTLCQNSDEVVVTVTGGPLTTAPASLPASICQGETVQLYANAGGGSGTYTYTWTSNPAGIPAWSSTLANPVVSPAISTQYLLTVHDGFNNVSGSVTENVHPLPTATISGGDTLCGDNAFTTLQVDFTGTPPWNFTWSYGSTSVVVNGQQVTPYMFYATDPGDYTVTAVEDAHCNGTGAGTAIVRHYPVPATPTITQNGNELISSACCGNQWYRNDTLLPGETGQTFHSNVSGLYHVTVTLNGCSSLPSADFYLSVGIPETSAGSFTYYPNPAHDQLTINLSKPLNGNLQVSLCSAEEIVVRTYSFNEQTRTFNLDISNLAKGFYFLNISVNGIRTIGKLIVD